MVLIGKEEGLDLGLEVRSKVGNIWCSKLYE